MPIQSGPVLLIVVGAHLRAEVADRPLAYKLQHIISRWVGSHKHQLNIALAPVVCTDVWYINNESLHVYPTISLGGPGVNALSAFFGQKLLQAVVHDEKMMIQLDPEFTDLRASIWGANHEMTVKALDCFMENYLEGFIRAALTQVEPQEN